MVIPERKKELLKNLNLKLIRLQQNIMKVLLLTVRDITKIVDVWAQTNEKLSKVMIENLSQIYLL